MICPNSLCPSHNQPEIAPALSKYLIYKSFLNEFTIFWDIYKS